MHIAVDAHNLLTDRRGIGVYLRAVLTRVLGACEVTLLVRAPLPRMRKRALERELADDRFSVASRVPRDADVVWNPWNGTFFDARGIASVTTIHDVAPFAFPAQNERLRHSQQLPFERSARASRAILADSTFTASEVSRYLDVAAERISVVALAADDRYEPGEPDSLPDELRGRPYLLYVGAIEPRKNVETLVRAWRSVFAGGEVALAMVSEDAVPVDVVHLQGLSLKALRDAYRMALALVFPSVYEGFGLPPLEAMACGTPVAVSRSSSLPEVCGEAALYAEADDVEAWCAVLKTIVEDAALRKRLRAAGIARAREFSWDRTAEQTLGALKAAAATS